MERLKLAPSTEKALEYVAVERARQDSLWGEQNPPDGTGSLQQQDRAKLQKAKTNRLFRSGAGTWADILEEEVAEALAERDTGALQVELIQVAAVCVAWVEAIRRRNG